MDRGQLGADKVIKSAYVNLFLTIQYLCGIDNMWAPVTCMDQADFKFVKSDKIDDLYSRLEDFLYLSEKKLDEQVMFKDELHLNVCTHF